MTAGSRRRSWRKLLRTNVPRAAVLLGLVALAGSIAGANLARAAGPPLVAVDQGGISVERACSDAPQPGFAACFAERVVGSQVALPQAADAVVSGFGPVDLQSAYALPSGLGAGKTVAHRRRLRPSDRRIRSRRLPQPVRAAAVHDRQRLLPQDQPERRLHAARRELRLGRGDRPRHRHGLGDLPAVQDPAGRGEQLVDRESRHRGEPGRGAGRRGRLEQLRRVGELVRVELGHELLPAPRRRDHRVERRQRLRDELSGRVALRDLGRRHLALPRVQRARLDGDGVVGRRQRLLDLRVEAVVPDRHRLLAPDDRRRLRGREPRDRRSRVRHVRHRWQLARLRRHERGVADHRIGLRDGDSAGRERVPGSVPVRQHGLAVRRDERQQRLVRRVVPLHGRRRLRRTDRARHAQRRRGLRAGLRTAPERLLDLREPDVGHGHRRERDERDRLDRHDVGQRAVGLARARAGCRPVCRRRSRRRASPRAAPRR